MDILNAIPDAGITLGPVIKITDPIMLNVCLAACAESAGMNMNNISRYWLEYLHIDVTENRITGSNGFMVVSAEALDCSAWLDGSLLIKPERPLPTGSKSVYIHESQQLITGIDGYGRSFSTPYRMATAWYPDISVLIASIQDANKQATDCICVNQCYLMKLYEALNMRTCYPELTPYRLNNGSSNPLGYAIDFKHPGILCNYTAIITSVNQ
jgi:hypothetical protein